MTAEEALLEAGWWVSELRKRGYFIAPILPSEAMIERMASAAYWQRVNPNIGHVTLSVAVKEWDALDDEHRSGIQIWHCKAFWRAAARAAYAALTEERS